MRYFPSFVDLRGGSVLVVGARDQAIAKLRLLLRTEAALEVVAPEADAPVVAWASAGRLTWTARRFVPADAERRRLVFVATGEVVRNREIAFVARAFCGLVTVVDDREASTALTPAIIDRDPVIVAVSSGGYAPSLARRIKAEIEALLPSGVGALARLAAGARRSAPRLGAPSLRAALARFFGGAGERALRAGGEAAAQAALDRLLAEASRTTPQGSVALVGAGPGDPDLLTLKARRLLDRAEVVLYDRLVDPRVLELARREARLIEVGKAPGGPGWSQDAINALMVEAARAGSRVVRLKSGDPLVFGRADEEIAALDAAGIEREIVPGITAAVAAAASAGFSLTRRGRNRQVTLLTGQDAAGLAEHDWKALARADCAFAIYMGVAAARFVQGRLMMHGARPDTAVTVVENASRPSEKRLYGTLAGLAELLAGNGVEGPAVIFVGLAPHIAEAQLDAAAVATPPRRTGAG